MNPRANMPKYAVLGAFTAHLSMLARGAGAGSGEQGVWQGQPGTRSMKFIMPSSRPRSMIAGSPDL
ncbi:Uncharacterised protein [Mycobacteroides abscessus subsp. abscessus]|nr:Uncharacterised protein [Mycobacteroides abscessus subsp. abscessus]SKX13263.1 Uncharacterised protein [Mycobacteroides abscessus subsp. abscessus]